MKLAIYTSLTIALVALNVTTADAACTVTCSRTINGDFDVVPTGTLTGTPSDPCDVESGKVETAIFSSTECPTNYVDCVDGSLTFDENGGTFATGGGTSYMDELTCIKGHLTIIDTDLINLNLPELLSLGGDVEITDNDDLANIYFPALEIVGDTTGLSNDDDIFFLEQNPDLGNLQLTALEEVQGDFIIEYCEEVEWYNPTSLSPVLTEVDGDLTLKATSFGDTDFLGALTTINGTLDLWLNRSSVSTTPLTDVSLPALTSVDNIEIKNNWELESISIPVLVDTGRILLLDNGKNSTQAVTLDFDDLVTSGTLEIDFMKEMEEITADFFPVLEEVDGKFQIEDCDQMTAMEFPELDTVGGEFLVLRNNELDDIDSDSFSALMFVGDKFTISFNPELATIVFDNLETVGTAYATNDNFDIQDNDKLTTVSFSDLETVYGRVWVWDNPLLTTLGLAYLDSAFRLRVKDNGSLGAAIALRGYWDSLDACNCGTGTLSLSSSNACEYSGNLTAGNDIMSYVCACEAGGPPGYPGCP